MTQWLFFSNWLLLHSDRYSLVGQHCARILKTSPLSIISFSSTLIHSCFPQNNKRRPFHSARFQPFRSLFREHPLYENFQLPLPFPATESSWALSCKRMTLIMGDVDISHQNVSFTERLCFLLLSQPDSQHWDFSTLSADEKVTRVTFPGLILMKCRTKI